MHLVLPIEQTWLVSLALVFHMAIRQGSDWVLSQHGCFAVFSAWNRKEGPCLHRLEIGFPLENQYPLLKMACAQTTKSISKLGISIICKICFRQAIAPATSTYETALGFGISAVSMFG
ncbi:hypothetical protein BDW59DRAFT_11498 [Aspergillus cavernicola]|uniref:Secreted protein n=1 Tax=Aspergillus cavernicola TaxID=176166 RepID=A0ABR4HL99_9EURO